MYTSGGYPAESPGRTVRVLERGTDIDSSGRDRPKHRREKYRTLYLDEVARYHLKMIEKHEKRRRFSKLGFSGGVK